MTEQELVQRCRAGDREARRELYERTSGRIYHLLLRMTGNREDALELAQEAYVRAFNGCQHFDGHSSVGTWLYRIAVNEALQFLRRGRRARSAVAGLAAGGVPQYEEAWSDARLDVREALAALSPDDRAILLLRYQDGLNYRAIAEVLDCPAGTVASRLNRAREKLRSALAGDYAATEEGAVAGHPKK